MSMSHMSTGIFYRLHAQGFNGHLCNFSALLVMCDHLPSSCIIILPSFFHLFDNANPFFWKSCISFFVHRSTFDKKPWTYFPPLLSLSNRPSSGVAGCPTAAQFSVRILGFGKARFRSEGCTKSICLNFAQFLSIWVFKRYYPTKKLEEW